ncbi:MAG: twin-arginine translocase subunit TatC, partial [Chthoniobacterales bacterium]|nr:twin-arginine translocase subunit TatC [Chthoniobacterales bacterium]
MWWRKLFEFREIEDEPKPFFEHLEDLRSTLLRCLVALGIAMGICFLLREEIATIIQKPLESVTPEHAKNLQSLGVADSMMISLEIAFYSGVVLAFPLLLYFIAQFIIPGLTQTERGILLPASVGGFCLFLIGVIFAYFIVLPAALGFFFEDAKRMNWQPSWTVREYYSFATQFIIAFGLAFELPVVVFALVKIGLLS